MKRTFLVVYEKGKKHFGGFAPDVPGCVSLGGSLEEMRINLKEALELYMESALELGYALPEATSTTVQLPLEGETDPSMTYVIERLTVRIPELKLTKPRAAKAKATPPSRRDLQAA